MCFARLDGLGRRQELQIEQDMPKGGLLLSHRIDIFHHVDAFLFPLFFSRKVGFSRITIGNYTPLEKETSLFAKISHFFQGNFVCELFCYFDFFKGKRAFFESDDWDCSKKSHSNAKPLSKEVGCGWQVGVFRSGWGWGSLPSVAGF